MNIQFLNHACVKIITETVTLVCDPWFSGRIFNDGWELIWTSEQLYAIAANSDFVWISHEHPDHFSPEFFRRIKEKRIDVLFQATRDRRLARYLTKNGFNVHEIKDQEVFPLSSVDRLMIGRNGLYDSWCLVVSGDKTILNLNDTIIKTDADLRALRKRLGKRFAHIDVLLTQFNYAGWVGDKGNKTLREDAAKRRLEVVRKQIEHLEPSYVIPFASFAYFCHEENSYLNDSGNKIPDFLEVCRGTKSIPVVMQPTDTWCVGTSWDNAPAIEFWEQAYKRISSSEPRKSHSAVDVAVLKSQCAAYQSRIFAINSRSTMRILSALPFLNLFRPIHIRLVDLRRSVRFSFFDELREVEDTRPADIEMSSDSLSFIFANEFGFDTLLVNGRLSADEGGLDLVLRNFAIGNLNAMGWSIGLGMLGMCFEIRLILLVLRELKHINPASESSCPRLQDERVAGASN